MIITKQTSLNPHALHIDSLVATPDRTGQFFSKKINRHVSEKTRNFPQKYWSLTHLKWGISLLPPQNCVQCLQFFFSLCYSNVIEKKMMGYRVYMKENIQKISGLFQESRTKNRKKVMSFCMSGTATVAESADAAGLLRQLLHQSKPVVLDLSEITEADVSFIQLLISLGVSVKKNKQEISLATLPTQHPLRIAAHMAGSLPHKTENGATWFGLPLINEEKK